MHLPVPTDAEIQRIIDLVVAEVAPIRIVLFGSAARGEQHEGSDVDLMVMVGEGTSWRGVAKCLRHAFYREGVNASVDLVVVDEREFERYRDTVGFIYRTIAREGRSMYAA